MTRANPFGLPGIDARIQGETYEVHWGKDEQIIKGKGIISSAARDSGNTPTTTLRGGLVLARLTDSGKYVAYSATGANGAGSDRASAILEQGVNLLDYTGTAVDRLMPVLLGGPIRDSQCFGLDGHAKSALSRHFVFEDALNEAAAQNYGGLGPPNALKLFSVYASTNTVTLTAEMSGSIFLGNHSTNMIYTLPTLAAGLRYRVINLVDFTVTINGAAGTIVKKNNAAANSVAFVTAGELIGATIDIIANHDATKWLTYPAGGFTIT